MANIPDPTEASYNKPLICLYKFAELANRYDREEASLDLTMTGLVQLLPAALRHPELASMQVLIQPISFGTDNYVSTSWNFRTELSAFDETVGSLEVSYSREVGEAFYGPFTADEVMLFMYIANRISRIIERFRIRKQLQLEKKSLREANTALSAVLKRIQNEQSELGKAVQSNIDKIVIPMLNSMLLTAGKHQKDMLHAVINSLNEITSPFASRLSSEFSSLTPQELLICNLIKEGMSSKEIAQARGLSFATVNNHRANIRRKLSLNNKEINLRTYLANNLGEPKPE